jgi:hypothetical protein
MVIRIKFDYYGKTVFIPDGYIADVNKLQTDFLKWVKDQPGCITEVNGIAGLSYDADDFLCYINQVILAAAEEKAYFTEHTNKRRIKTISF